jgi:hypothetical protein
MSHAWRASSQPISRPRRVRVRAHLSTTAWFTTPPEWWLNTPSRYP